MKKQKTLRQKYLKLQDHEQQEFLAELEFDWPELREMQFSGLDIPLEYWLHNQHQTLADYLLDEDIRDLLTRFKAAYCGQHDSVEAWVEEQWRQGIITLPPNQNSADYANDLRLSGQCWDYDGYVFKDF